MKNTQAFLYKWTHLPSGKWYIGSRTAQGCHVNDGYICSSKTVKPMIVENFSDWKREILVVGESKYIRQLERLYLTKIDAKNDSMSFNKTNADRNFSIPGEPLPDQVKELISIKLKGKSKPPRSDKHKENLSLSQKGNVPWNKGKKMSAEYCQALSSGHTGKSRKPRSEKTKGKISLAFKGRVPWNKGVKSIAPEMLTPSQSK